MITKEKKQEIISKYQRHESDSGSPEVQISILTWRINEVSAHLDKNKHDFASKRGLQKMVALRKSLMGYLLETNSEKYHQLIEDLGIRGIKTSIK